MNFVSPSGHSHNVHDSDEADKHPGHSILKKRGYKYQGTGEGFGGNLEHHYTHGSNPKEHVVLQKVKYANGEVEHVWRQYGSKGGYREGRNAEGLHHAAVKEENMADKNNGAFQITSAIETLLRKKTVEAIEETRKQVAADAFGIQFEDPTQKIQEQIDAAYDNKVQLDERSEVDHPLAKELASQAVHNHEQFHQGNHDAHHGGWAMHDLHQWAKNYAKKKDKGVYDKEKAVKGLTHAIKNSEPSYFGKAHHEKSGQTVSGATRTQAARHLLPHVEKLMDQHGKKKVTEAREPQKNTGVHERLKRHGFEYKGTKNGFRKYTHPNGDEVKHKFPTLNGNHSFTHTGPTGKVVTKSANTGDTEIQDHLHKHFPNKATSSAWKGVDEARDPFGMGKKHLAQLRTIDKTIKNQVAATKPKKVSEAEIAEKRDPFGHSKKDLERLGAIDKSIKREVAAGKSQTQKDLEDWRKHDRGAKPRDMSKYEKCTQKNYPGCGCGGYHAKSVDEAEKEHHSVSKPASDVASHDEVARHDKMVAAIRAKASHGQAAFNQKWHSAKSDDERKALKKHAFQNDLDIPWHAAAAHASKSPIHSFAEHIKQEGK